MPKERPAVRYAQPHVENHPRLARLRWCGEDPDAHRHDIVDNHLGRLQIQLVKFARRVCLQHRAWLSVIPVHFAVNDRLDVGVFRLVLHGASCDFLQLGAYKRRLAELCVFGSQCVQYARLAHPEVAEFTRKPEHRPITLSFHDGLSEQELVQLAGCVDGFGRNAFCDELINQFVSIGDDRRTVHLFLNLIERTCVGMDRRRRHDITTVIPQVDAVGDSRLVQDSSTVGMVVQVDATATSQDAHGIWQFAVLFFPFVKHFRAIRAGFLVDVQVDHKKIPRRLAAHHRDVCTFVTRPKAFDLSRVASALIRPQEAAFWLFPFQWEYCEPIPHPPECRFFHIIHLLLVSQSLTVPRPACLPLQECKTRTECRTVLPSSAWIWRPVRPVEPSAKRNALDSSSAQHPRWM